MKYSIVLCMLLSSAFAAPKQSGHPIFYSRGSESDYSTRVVGGQASGTGQFPYQCALLRTGSLSCGSWVINANTIGTACHCIDGAQPAQITIRCGSNQWGSGGQLRTVARLIPNPNYNSATIDHDIGLIILSSPLDLTDPNVVPVDLPAASYNLPDGQAVTATGWGRLSTNGAIPADQQYVNLRGDGRPQCLAYWNNQYITDRMECAGAQNANQGICNGDSGGALVLTGTKTIVGTMSFRTSLGCAYPNYPEVYARIAAFIDWINANLQN